MPRRAPIRREPAEGQGRRERNELREQQRFHQVGRTEAERQAVVDRHLDDRVPWGIWIGLDVAAGVALAAGGFTTAALGHIWHRDKYEVLIRPALLTAMLGYTFVAFGVVTDIGRWYYVWHPLIMWNGNSALFEVGRCVMIYLSVLYIEFLPIVTERFIGRVNLPGFLSALNKVIDSLLRLLDRTLNKFMFVFIIAGVVLSCLHQSSLGTLMIIAGEKMHPLWQTPVLPLLFLLSAFSVGFPMVIMESLSASKSFGIKPEKDVLTSLSRFVGPILGIYLAAKIGDMFIRETFVYLTELNLASIRFTVEISRSCNTSTYVSFFCQFDSQQQDYTLHPCL